MLLKAFKNKNFIIGFILISFIVILMIISLFYTPYDPTGVAGKAFSSPNSNNLLGTDNFGRDILSRIMKGSQLLFIVGILTVLIGLSIGLILGSLSGYFGKILDLFLMRFIDAQMCFPGILIALMLVSVFGVGISNTIIALGIMAVPQFTRIIRSGYIKCKELDYVKAAKAKGASSFRIMYIHILPNISSTLMVTCTLAFSTAVIQEAALSYLGVGIQPPDPSWGTMLKEAQAFMLKSPHYAIIPGIFITLLVLGLNLLGDGLRDTLDIKS